MRRWLKISHDEDGARFSGVNLLKDMLHILPCSVQEELLLPRKFSLRV